MKCVNIARFQYIKAYKDCVFMCAGKLQSVLNNHPGGILHGATYR